MGVSDLPSTDRFLRACRREPVDRTPVWFMRQAGRYLPEYREVRGDGDILDTCLHPDLVAEITMQPLRRMAVDAAILFSDIMVPLAAVGVPVRIEPGVGPVVDEPIRTLADVAKLRPLEPDVDVPHVLDAIRLLRKELEVPLLGFAGAPFTLASYLIEGGPSRTHERTKALMLGEPGVWDALMDALVAIVVPHLRAQVDAGAQALQVFDSWVGALGPDAYERSVLPHMRRLFDGVADVGVPTIHFGVGTGELLALMRRAGGDVIGVDWRTPLDVAWERRRAGHGGAGQPRPRGAVGAVGRGGGRDRPRAGPRERARRAHLQPGARRAADHRSGHASTARGSGPRAHRATGGNALSDAPIGVLVMAYGTASGPDDIERYYTDIRGGRAPSPEHLAELQDRYAAIGNVFPLLDTTRAQAEGLVERLNTGADAFRAYLGMKHSEPFIPQAIATMRADGIERAIGIVMAPHWSGMSVETYIERVIQATEDDGGGPAFTFVRTYHDHPAFIGFLTARVAEALDRLTASERANASVIFSAHSLPVRTLDDGTLRCKTCDCDDSCRYRDGLQETADLVANGSGCRTT